MAAKSRPISCAHKQIIDAIDSLDGAEFHAFYDAIVERVKVCRQTKSTNNNFAVIVDNLLEDFHVDDERIAAVVKVVELLAKQNRFYMHIIRDLSRRLIAARSRKRRLHEHLPKIRKLAESGSDYWAVCKSIPWGKPRDSARVRGNQLRNALHNFKPLWSDTKQYLTLASLAKMSDSKFAELLGPSRLTANK